MSPGVLYRPAESPDIPGMASIRAAYGETLEYWTSRISGYLDGTSHPQQALASRIIYVAVDGDSIVGFVAGHLTRRFACDGELRWIDVLAERRGQGIAQELLRHLAAWFVQHNALKICVDVQPPNTIARKFYMRAGAVALNPHWLVWHDIKVSPTRRLCRGAACCAPACPDL